jgi:multiple antibiotic resistance protein
MDGILEFSIVAFASLFTMMNPIGVIPVYISLTSHLSPKAAKKVAYKAVLTGLITLVLFALAGKFIFDFFAITIHSLRIVGGIIFFIAGYDMLQARLNRTKSNEEEHFEANKDVAISPLGIPLITGPGAITVAIVLFNDAADISLKITLFAIIFLMMGIVLISLLSGRHIMRFLGENGNKVLMRIMGLIVMVIAVEFLFSGLTPLVRKMLMLE